MRKHLGIVAAAFLLAGCDHNSKTETSEAASPGDATYTGLPPAHPRAVPVAQPIVQAASPTIPKPTPPPERQPAPLAAEKIPEPTTQPPPTPIQTPDVTPPTPPAVVAPTARPMSDAEARKQVVILETSIGRMVIELDDVAAPRTCGNFRKLVASGFYSHTLFHRVIPNFMIQGGDPNSKSDDRKSYGQGDPGYTLPAEIKLKCVAGAVAMARLQDSVNPQRDSNGSQFFICVADCPSLDDKYTVFGHVIRGLDTAVQIANLARDDKDDPTSRMEINATLEPKKQALDENPR